MSAHVDSCEQSGANVMQSRCDIGCSIVAEVAGIAACF